MKKFTLICLLCFLWQNSIAQHIISAVAKNGGLRVDQGVVVNQNGVLPQLRGISFSWSVWGGKKYYKQAVADWLTADFKVTIIRLAMAVQPDHGYLQESEEQYRLITSMIDQAIKNGIYVLVDWHDHHSNAHVTEAKQFFTRIAKKYHGVPNVIYEIWNEPEVISWDKVKNYAMALIPVIRKYDAHNLIIVGSPHWDQDVDIAALDPVTGFNNIAYSFHFYASDSRHQDGLRSKADLAIRQGLPLFVTEWGVGEANGNGQFDREESKAWLTWLEKNRLSWVNWNLTDKKETTALLTPGAAEDGRWRQDELTEAGVYIREILRRLN